MIEELINNGCIKYGSFKLKSNEISKYYFDMKGLVSHPSLMADIGTKIHNELLDKVHNHCYESCYEIAKKGLGKKQRSEEFSNVKENLLESFSEEELEENESLILSYFYKVEK